MGQFDRWSERRPSGRSMTIPTATAVPTLPREIAPGIHWLAGCNRSQFHGRTVHNHNSLYVIQGRDRSAIYDTGQPSDWQKIAVLGWWKITKA